MPPKTIIKQKTARKTTRPRRKRLEKSSPKSFMFCRLTGKNFLKMVRRAGRRPSPGGSAGLADRRGGRCRGGRRRGGRRRGGRRRYHGDVPAAGPAIGPGGELAARPRGRVRRPDRRDARQPGRVVGVDAGGDQARRGGDSLIDAAGARRPGRQGGPWPRAARHRASRPRYGASRRRRPAAGTSSRP